MDIFDVFTGNSAKNAAAQNNALYQNYGNTATSALNSGLTNSVGALNTGLGQSTGALNSGAGQAVGAVQSGLNSQIGAYGSGLQNQMDAYGQQAASYQPLSDLGAKYGGATNLLLGSLGANGAQGTQDAQNAFQAGPGYQWNVNQQLDALNRAGVARGQAIGNTSADVMARAQGLANQEYGNWRSNLAGFVNPQLQATQGAAQGQAGAYNNMGSAYGNNAQNVAGAYGNAANNTANTWNNLGQNLAGAYGSTANSLAGAYGNNAQNLSNVQGNVASGTANSNTAAANAAMQGSSQFWNGLMNMGSAAAKAGTSGSGVGSVLTNLWPSSSTSSSG